MDPFYLFLCLLVRGVFSAPAAKLGKLYFAFHLFLVFAAPIAHSFTALTLELYKIILGHRSIVTEGGGFAS